MLRELRKPLWLVTILAGVLVGYFALYPGQDLVICGLFFNEEQFTGQTSKIAKLFDYGIYVVAYGLGVIGTYQVCRLFWRDRRLTPVLQKWLFFVVVLVFGAGLVAQGMKFAIERPRPYSLVQFGGTSPFVPALQKFDSGFEFVPPANRSFPSGHTAGAFSVAALAVVAVRPSIRKRIFYGGVVFSLLAGAMRVWEGNHHPSDVAGSILMMGTVMLFLDWIFPSLCGLTNQLLNRYFKK